MHQWESNQEVSKCWVASLPAKVPGKKQRQWCGVNWRQKWPKKCTSQWWPLKGQPKSHESEIWVEWVQTHLLQCPRTELRVQTEDSLWLAEAQQTLDGLLQRNQVAITHVSRWVLVILDHDLTQWWLLECFKNQHPTSVNESTWHLSLLDSVATRQQLHSGSQLLSLTWRTTEPERES